MNPKTANHNVRLGLIFASITACTIMLSFAISEAEAHNTYVSLVRSEMCVRTDCIKVGDIMQFDNSTQLVSGKFVYDEKKGDYTRKPGMKNSLEYYRVWDGKTIIFAEPDQYTILRSKHLVILPSLPEYATAPLQKKNQTDYSTDTRYLASGIYADPRCQTVTVGVKESSVKVALDYLLSGCKEGQTPQLEEIKTKKNRDYYCGKQCQHEKWLKEALEKSKSRNLLREK